jgi:hypothetical protein
LQPLRLLTKSAQREFASTKVRFFCEKQRIASKKVSEKVANSRYGPNLEVHLVLLNGQGKLGKPNFD